MNWGSTANFLHMGGYGLYVWGSFGLAAVCMLAEPLLALQRHRAARRALNDAADTAQPESQP